MQRFTTIAIGLATALCAQQAMAQDASFHKTQGTKTADSTEAPGGASGEVPQDAQETRTADSSEVPGGTSEAVSQDAPTVSSAAQPSVGQAETETYQPLTQGLWNGIAYSVPLHIGGAAQGNSSYSLDRFGTETDDSASVQPLLRFGAKFSTLKKFSKVTFQGEYEHDLLTGAAGQGLSMDDEGQLSDRSLTTQLRKAYAVAAVDNRFWLGAGVMTSQWGMGLLANDGAQYWQPGSARFTAPRGGDRVIRGFAVIGLNRSLGLGLTFGADRVLGDDILLTEADRLGSDMAEAPGDDDAQQFIAALKIGEGKKTSGGVYAAYRDQTAFDGSSTQVLAIDMTGKTELGLSRGKLQLEGEAVFITGETTWAPTMDFGTHDVTQLGAAARASYHDKSDFGSVLDVLYASGDQNFDDQTQTGFRTDRNYEMGMLLFRQVLASQTARGVGTASDPDLVGEPAADIERFATRGAATNTVAFFPRGYYRPLKGLEVYGGPLVAFTPVKYADPLNSRLAGGTARNAVDGDPGNYLGTELDVGLRYRTLFGGTELTIGLEGGVLLPGTVFKDINDNSLGNIYGARAMLDYHL